VDQLVEDEVALGVLAEVGLSDEFLEVPPVVVDVAGHDQLPLGGEIDDLGLAQGRKLVLFRGGLEGFDHAVGAEGRRGGRHIRSIGNEPRILRQLYAIPTLASD
jgi:hypothetical protein